MNDPDEAHRLTQERITKLEKDKEQAERLVEKERVRAEESKKNEENAKRLAEKERARGKQVERLVEKE